MDLFGPALLISKPLNG